MQRIISCCFFNFILYRYIYKVGDDSLKVLKTITMAEKT